MTDTDDTHELPYGDHDYVVATARGIVTNELMIADLTDQAWQISLALMIDKLAEVPNLGLVLVPLLPHANLHWINGTAPGMTMQCQLVAKEDLDALHTECERMYAALHPNEPPLTKDTTNEQED